MNGAPRLRAWLAVLLALWAAGCEPTPSPPPPGPPEVPAEGPPPTVDVEGVAEGQVSREPLRPTWRVTGREPLTVEARLDGADFAQGAEVGAEGTHALAVTARDGLGREARARVGFAIDTTAPRITLSGVEEGERRNTPVVLGWTVEEAHPGPVEATLDGAPVAVGDTVSAEGEHVWRVVATDTVGHRTEARRAFTLDLTPPGLTVLSPAPDSVTREASVELVVAVDEPGSTVWLGGQSFSQDADGHFRGTVMLEEGGNVLVVLARDVAGNGTRLPWQVTRDSTPPRLTLTAPEEGAKVAGDSVRVEGRAEDATPLTVRVGGQRAAVDPDGHFQLPVAVAPGAVSLEVVATDAAGNATRRVLAVRVNTTPPRLELTAPASGTVTEASSISVSGFARAADRTDAVTLEVSGHTHAVGADGRFSVEAPLAPGPNTVSVTAVDGYGLRTSRAVRVERQGAGPGPVDGGSGGETPDAGAPPPADGGGGTPDAGGPPDAGGEGEAPPELVLVSPAEDSLWGQARVPVLGRVERGTAPFQVTVEEVPVAVTGRQFSTALALPEGATLLRVRVVDALGRSAEARRAVRVDQTPPFLEVLQPEQPVTVVSESPLLVEGLAGDAHLAGVSVNGEPTPVLGGHFSASVPLTPGDNTLDVEAVDLAGNRSHVSRTVRVDGMPPRLRVLEPAEGAEAREPVVRVTVRVEAVNPLAEVHIGTGLATLSGPGEYTAQVPLALGENVIALRARDSLGLTGTASVRVRYRDARTEPLTVTGVDPPDQREGVAPDALVNVAFNKPVKAESVRGGFTVLAQGLPLAGGWSVAPGGQTVSFIAREPLPESATLQVRVAGVEAVQGPGMQGEFRSGFTVRRPLTRLSGAVVDEHHEPQPDVRIEVEGQGVSTHTGPDGTWALAGVTAGPVVLRYEGGAAAPGTQYPTVRRGFAVEAERDNVDAPLMRVPVDLASAETVDTAGPVHLALGGKHGALEVDIPAGGLTFADGTTRGVVTATALPALARPVPFEGTVGPARLWQLQPAGTRLVAPVTLRLPNRDAAPPGHQALLFAYAPDALRLRPVGLATVNADGTRLVSAAPVEAGSLEYFGYLMLPEASAPPASASPGRTAQGLVPGASWLNPPGITPVQVVASGYVAGPREQAVALTLDSGLLVEGQSVVLTSGGSYRLPLAFMARVLSPPAAGAESPLVATVTAKGPGGQVLGPPAGRPWRQESPQGTRVELSSEVELVPGTTQLTLAASTARGRDSVRVDAELTVDPRAAPDGGAAWRLRVHRVSASSAEGLEANGLVRFAGMPVFLEGTWGNGAAVSGPDGRFVTTIPHLSSFFLPPTLVRACVNLPPWPRVRAWTDAAGRVQTQLFTNAAIAECAPVSEVWFTQEQVATGVISLDARYLHGQLTFVDREGHPLPPACESSREPGTGRVLGLSPEEVRTTEVHFFLEQDPREPIATYTVAHPFDCDATPASGAQARYAQLRMGPSALRWMGDAVPPSLRRNATRLVPGDRLVVFAINHATGHAGLDTVTVPPIVGSTRDADGRCAADDAAGGPLTVIEGGQSVPLSRCTLQELGIPADLRLYPPEIDVRVDRRARAQGVERPMEASLVRHGGAATTRDEFIRIVTDWRVRRAPAPARPAPVPRPPAEASCDGGVKEDGGGCAPGRLVDEGLPGHVLERYCAEFTPPLTDEQRAVCLKDDRALSPVPAGVPPLAGRVVRITGSAVEEPVVATFPVPPGRSTSTVQTALRLVGQDGRAVELNNLPRANHYVQVVGHSVFPRDLNHDGVLQPAERNAPPPDFSDGVGAPGLPRAAVQLKNVYRSLETDGGARVERYDRAREHEFRVLEVGSAEVSARTDRETRPLWDGGTSGTPPAASLEDVSYAFLLHLLAPGDPGRAETLSGEYALRLGSDAFGIECPIEVDAARGTLRGSCEGEYVPEVLSASDVVYLEVYLRGNAENVLYRFNFDGLSLREDYVGVASAFTAARSVEEAQGRPVLDRPISQLNEAHFFLGPQQLERGRVRLCTTEDCGGSNALIKEALLHWTGTGGYTVQDVAGGRATARLVQETAAGAGGARHLRLALPASLTAMPGTDTSPSGIYLVTDAELPRPKHDSLRLGIPRGRFQGLTARAPGQPSVDGIGLADLRLSFTHTDFSVPQYAETVSFSRTYSNQNDLPSALGVGWRHEHDGFVWEETLGRYVVVLGGQAWGFNTCLQVDAAALTARQCQTDKTHGMSLEVTGRGVEVTTEYGHVYRFDRPAVKRDQEGRRKWLLTKFHDGHGRGESEGWTHFTYAEETNRLTRVERTPGALALEFKYCADFSQEDCTGLPADASGLLKALARREGFKLLAGVVLSQGGAPLHTVRFTHDTWGNLLEAERTTDPPAQRWRYTYAPVPGGLPGRDASRALNELSEARLEVAGQPQWKAVYTRGGAECYAHLEDFECVTGVTSTGSQGQPLTVRGSTGERTVTLPEGALTRMGLNDYGNALTTRMGSLPARTMTWPSSTRGGEVRLASSRSAKGRTVEFLADERLRAQGLQVPGASDVAGLTGPLVSVTSRSARGQPEAGTLSTAAGSTAWSTPRTVAGDVMGMTVGTGKDAVSLFSRTLDAEGRVLTETDATGTTSTWSFGGPLQLPLSAQVRRGDDARGLVLEYDAFGRLTRRRDQRTGAEETWTHDGQGHVLRHARSGEPAEVWTYAYAYGDQRLTVTERLEGVASTRTSVFQEGLLTGETVAAAGASLTRAYTYEGGRLTSRTDERGVVWAHTYDDAGRLTALTANGQPAESYGLDADGQVTALTDREGRTIHIGYDTLGQPISWRYEDGHQEQVRRDARGAIVWQRSGSPGAASEHVFDQQVDALGRVLSTRSASGGAGGVDLRATYDAAGRVLTREDLTLGLRETFAYEDALGRLTRHTRDIRSGAGVLPWEELRAYTDEGGRTQIAIQRTIGTGEGARTESQTRVLDALGRVLSEEVPGEGRVDFTHDARGRVLTRQHPVLGTVTQTYDGLGHLLSRDEPGGVRTTYTTDARGLVLTQQGPHAQERWTFAYDDFGRMQRRELAAAGSTPAAVWSYTYPGAGDVVETNPVGTIVTQRFNSRALLLSEQRGPRTTAYAYDGTWARSRTVTEGNWTSRETREFDDLGRALAEVEHGEPFYTYSATTRWTGRSATRTERWASSGAQTRESTSGVEVDSLGNVVAVEQGGLRDAWTYDAAGVLAREALAGRPETRFAYTEGRLARREQGPETTLFGYDGAGRLVSELDPSGRARTLQYDAQGQVKQERFGTEAEGLTTEYTYDPGGFLASATRGGARRVYTHGPRGELQSVEQPGGLGRFVYQYDALLQLTSLTPPAGGTAPETFAYDALGRTLRRTRGLSVWVTHWANGTSTTLDPNGDRVERTYDGRERVAREQYQPGSQSQPYTDLTAVTYAYDGRDRLLSAQETRQSGPVSQVYGYDARHRLVSLQRGGDLVTYAYTDSGQKRTVTSPSGTVHYAYDAQDRLRSVTSSQGPAVTVEWEPGGLLSKVSGNGVVEQYVHDGAARVRSITSTREASPLLRYEYTYDDRGNQTEERYTGPTSSTPEVTRYGYDLADRLTGVGYPTGEAELYGLGGEGSRREEKRVEGYLGSLGPDGLAQASNPTRHWKYSYDSSGGLHRIEDVLTGGVEAQVTTDEGGRVVSEVRGGTTRRYGWDAGGRLTRIQRLGAEPTVEATYLYGFDGLRRSRSSGGGTTRYVWGADDELLEEGPAAGPRLLYAGSTVGVVAVGGERLLHDALGSVVGRVGTSTQVSRYGAWGDVRAGGTPDASGPSLAYAGQSLDAVAGLSYAQQRWYDAGTGRFLSQDPVAGKLDTPEGLHAWAYAQGNPTRFVDPRGEAAFLAYAYGKYLRNRDARESVHQNVKALHEKATQKTEAVADYVLEKTGSPALAAIVHTGGTIVVGVPFGGAAMVADPIASAKENIADIKVPSTLRERLPGQGLDSETGIYQNNHRNYPPEIRRHAEADPISLQGGANLYAYTDANPKLRSGPLVLTPKVPVPTVVTDVRKLSQALTQKPIVIVNADHGAQCASDECKKAGNTNFGIFSTMGWFGFGEKHFFWPNNMPASVKTKIFVNLLCWGGAGAMGPQFLEAGGRVYIGAVNQPSAFTTSKNIEGITNLLNQKPNVTGSQMADELNMMSCRGTNPNISLEECRRHQTRRMAPNWVCQGNCDTPLSDVFSQ
ncbi:RHS repeat-associated core domain-containing protein [Archangium primigenium]|uniref:RHS repeat-associated core domain-containing protein n=1 Tax=[Archangium] primigenium TaxID=2792470 RepID=UPI001956F150|nr:RHS repeat-associated core domain-containing protein [Archangium primigenium]MBM7116846.1 Ig-like domain-containing protein [Archangium primigenium]